MILRLLLVNLICTKKLSKQSNFLHSVSVLSCTTRVTGQGLIKLIVIESGRRLVPVNCSEGHGGWEMNITSLGIGVKT